jgi:hypothetical protein
MPHARRLGCVDACYPVIALLLLAGCAGGGGANQPGPTDFAVGGSIAGLVDTGLVISNGSDMATIAAGATSFTMPARLAAGASFALSVTTQPPGQTCILSGSSGMAGAGSATAASVSCDQWTWRAGSAANDPVAGYGALNIPATGITPAGLALALAWTDTVGNAWLYGGRAAYDSGDLWRFDAASGYWAWMGASDSSGPYPGTQGVPNPAILPMPRSNSVRWRDAMGDAWIYGGQCFTAGCSGVLGDLWRFNATTKLWTWVGSPVTANQATVYGALGIADARAYPGSRMGASSWVDAAGNLWMYGGWSYNGNYYTILGDLWKYDRTTGYWAWMGGTTLSLESPNYGTRGVAAATNTPGSRFNSQYWTDHSGRLWLFGGIASVTAGQSGRASDLWQLDISTGWWTWIGGPMTSFDAGTRGKRGVPDSANWPSAREGASSWVDANGNLWMHGGTAHFTTGDPATHVADDLWRYNCATGIWTWMGGTGLPDAAAMHGNATGLATAGLTPGSRYWAASWTDSAGTLWLFGGSLLDAGGTAHTFGDLWSYHPPQFPMGQ